MRKNINIALVDDEALFVEGLSLLFSNVPHINVTKTASSGLAFLEALENNSEIDFPDIAGRTDSKKCRVAIPGTASDSYCKINAMVQYCLKTSNLDL